MIAPVPSPAAIEASILALTANRGFDKSICPSEVARAMWSGPPADGWQALLTPVRAAAIRLSRTGQVEILRKGRPVAPCDVKGVIRLRQVRPETGA